MDVQPKSKLVVFEWVTRLKNSPFYTGDKLPKWNGDVFVSDMRRRIRDVKNRDVMVYCMWQRTKRTR